MAGRKRIFAPVLALVLCASSAFAASTVVDLGAATPSPVPNVVDGGDGLFITNSDTAGKSATVTGDWDIASDGKLYIGFVEKGSPEEIAAGQVKVVVDGDMNVSGGAWIGKWNTAIYAAFFPELPIAPSNDVVLKVIGDLNIDINAGGFQAFMVGAEGAGSSTVIDVAGDTVIKTGGNHFTGYDNSTLNLTTSRFILDGGEIEVIGTSYVKTTTDIATADAVHLKNGADLTIMRHATFDLAEGGNFTVEGASELTGGSGGGTIIMRSGNALTISSDSTVNLWRGSLEVTGSGSTVNLNGTLILGYHPSATDADGLVFTSFTAANMVVADTARIQVTDDFVKKALADHITGDAGITVIAGTESLDYTFAGSSWDDGDQILFSNYYGDFVFTRTGDTITFKNLEASAYFGDTAVARAAMADQIAKVYAANRIDRRNINKGLVDNALGAAQSVMGVATPGIALVTSDKSDAGDFNHAMLMALGLGDSTFTGGGVTGGFGTAFANMLNNNRGSGVNAVAMGVAGQVGSAIHGRIAANNAVLGKVRSETGSDYALASSILNCDFANRFWVGALGLWEDADERHGLSGYKYDSYGFVAGYDRVFGPVTIGAAFGYNKGDYEDKAAVAHDSDIENYAFSLYGAYNHCSGFFASVLGGYTYSDNNINEHDGIDWAREDFHTDTWNIGAKIGYDWRPTSCLTLTPSVGLNYIHAKNSDHSVRYAGLNLLRYRGMKNHATTLPVEMAVRYDVVATEETVVSLNANAGYSYNFHRDGIEGDIFLNGLGGATALRATGREAGRHTVNLGGGFKVTHKRFDFGVRYDYYGKADYDAHRVMGTVGVSF